MASKKGKVEKITEPTHEFAGSGVEGTKGGAATGSELTPSPPAPLPHGEGSFDKTGATCVVTMRNSAPVRIWFRNGKEIGAEDA